jgi:hypothetical protein
MQLFVVKKYLVLIAFVWITVAISPNTVLATDNASQNRDVVICFNFFPSVFSEKLDESAESIFLIVRGNGEAKVVHYGLNFRSDNIVVYQGILPKDYTAELIAKARRATAEVSRTRHYEGGPQDEPVFNLSIRPPDKSENEQHPIEYWGLLQQPQSVSALVNELRFLRKRLKKEQPAYAYVRRESIGRESPEYIKQDSRFRRVQSFPPTTRSILINAVRNPLNFYALSRSQVTQLLKSVSSRTSLYLIYNGYAYGLTLYLPRDAAHPSQQGISRNETTSHLAQKMVSAHSLCSLICH